MTAWRSEASRVGAFRIARRRLSAALPDGADVIGEPVAPFKDRVVVPRFEPLVAGWHRTRDAEYLVEMQMRVFRELVPLPTIVALPEFATLRRPRVVGHGGVEPFVGQRQVSERVQPIPPLVAAQL